MRRIAPATLAFGFLLPMVAHAQEQAATFGFSVVVAWTLQAT